MDSNTNTMKSLIEFLKNNLSLTAIPVRIKNEKRWESMDEIIENSPLDGMAQRVSLDENFGIVVYSWDELSKDMLKIITEKYNSLK